MSKLICVLAVIILLSDKVYSQPDSSGVKLINDTIELDDKDLIIFNFDKNVHFLYDQKVEAKHENYLILSRGRLHGYPQTAYGVYPFVCGSDTMRVQVLTFSYIDYFFEIPFQKGNFKFEYSYLNQVGFLEKLPRKRGELLFNEESKIKEIVIKYTYHVSVKGSMTKSIKDIEFEYYCLKQKGVSLKKIKDKY